jgi:hypothetical protein
MWKEHFGFNSLDFGSIGFAIDNANRFSGKV